jgi:putative spermidine/putrescine transport system permease protein
MSLSPGVLLRQGFLALIALFLAAPLIVVVSVSFNATRRMSFPPTEFSLRWYRAFFSDYGWMASLERSLTIAGLAALVSVAVALPITYAIWRYQAKVAALLAGIGGALFLIPGVVAALMLSAFWGVTGHVGRLENVVLSHAIVLLGIPLSLLMVGFRTIDQAQVEAAYTMGARDSDAFRMVVRPAMTPYILCAFVFVFVLSINEYLIAYMVAGFTVQTLPIKIFANMRQGYEPTMCVAAVIFMAMGFSAFALMSKVADLPRLMGRTRPLED